MIFDQNPSNCIKMTQNRAEFERISAKKYAKSAEICKKLQILLRKSTAACGCGDRPRPRGHGLPLAQHREIIGFPYVFGGCGLLRQRPAEAVPSWPAEAGRDEPKCTEIAQNLLISAENWQNLPKPARNWSEIDQKSIRNEPKCSKMMKNWWKLIN